MDPEMLLAFLPLVLLPAIWCGVGFLLATLSGWRALAARHPDREISGGARLRAVSGTFGWVNFNNAIAVELDARGVRFSLWLPFLFGFPPFYMAWSDFESVADAPGNFFRRVVLKPRDGVTIKLAGRAIEPVLAASRGGPVTSESAAAADTKATLIIVIAIGVTLAAAIAAMAIYILSK